MGFFVLTATLTTAGKTLIDTAKTNNQALKVDRISFGDSTATLNTSTTSIGNLVETAASITQATNLVMTRAEFQGLFRGAPAAKVGTIGVYSGTTLIGVARFTMPTSVDGDTQLAIRLDYANASVFAKTFTTVAASLLADTYKKAYDDSLGYLLNGAIDSKRALFGTSAGKEADWFCGFVNIIATQAEFTATLQEGAAEGTVAYYLQDSKKYMVTAGAWVVQSTGAMSDVVKPGRLYRSELTKSVYYARSSNDLLRVYQNVDRSADITMTLVGTTASKTVPMTVENVTLDYFFDNNTALVRRSTSGNITVPVGASKLYVRFVANTINVNSNFALTNNDVIESVLDWTNYKLPKIGFAGCANLVTVPGSYLPDTLTTMAFCFSDCVKFAPQTMAWDVSRITSFTSCFSNCAKLACAMPWNTVGCTDFSYMFAGCTIMNNGLNGWNMSNALTVEGMLMSCQAFNQPVNTWNMAKCTNFSYLFADCSAFNRSINTWNVRKGVTFDYMFQYCRVYNQPMNNLRPGADVPTGFTTRAMFLGCSIFNQPLNNWNVAEFLDMTEMFADAMAYNQNLSGWYIYNSRTPSTDYNRGTTNWLETNMPTFF